MTSEEQSPSEGFDRGIGAKANHNVKKEYDPRIETFTMPLKERKADDHSCVICGTEIPEGRAHVCPNAKGTPKREKVDWPCVECGGELAGGHRLRCEQCVESATTLVHERQDEIDRAIASMKAWVKEMQKRF